MSIARDNGRMEASPSRISAQHRCVTRPPIQAGVGISRFDIAVERMAQERAQSTRVSDHEQLYNRCYIC
jgi:hypothetical protein